MSATHPDLAAQACGWDPNDIVAGSHRNLEWICQLGHTWLATPKNRSRQNQGCPYCSGQRVLAGFNDLATVEPDLAREMVGDASTITRGSNKKVTWRCDLGHEWDESPKKRKEGGCPYCSSHRVWPGFNDLATTHPQLAEQLVEVDPTTITAGSNRPCAWRCVRDHVWVVPPYNRMIGMGCPFCSGKRVLAGFNDLATTHPEIAATAEGWDVTALTAGSNKKVGWRCEKGHDFSMAVANRALRFQGCPVCLGKKVLPGVNDLATLRPEIAAQAHGWDPSTVVIYANKRREWRCHRGHTWTQTVAMRTTGNSCPYCANQLVWVGFNDLATTHPEIAAEADGWDPSSVTAGTDRSLLWSCPKGHPSYKARCSARTRPRGTGCPACTKHGFNPAKPAWLYLFEHGSWGVLQIGITNVPDQRLTTHESRGWHLIDLRGPMPGDVARAWEKSILVSLELHGASLRPETAGGRFDGYTEAWMRSEFPVTSLAKLMDLVYEDEQFP